MDDLTVILSQNPSNESLIKEVIDNQIDLLISLNQDDAFSLKTCADQDLLAEYNEHDMDVKEPFKPKTQTKRRRINFKTYVSFLCFN